MATVTGEMPIDADGMVEIAPSTKISADELMRQMQAKGYAVERVGNRLIVRNIPVPDDILARIRNGR